MSLIDIICKHYYSHCIYYSKIFRNVKTPTLTIWTNEDVGMDTPTPELFVGLGTTCPAARLYVMYDSYGNFILPFYNSLPSLPNLSNPAFIDEKSPLLIAGA